MTWVRARVQRTGLYRAQPGMPLVTMRKGETRVVHEDVAGQEHLAVLGPAHDADTTATDEAPDEDDEEGVAPEPDEHENEDEDASDEDVQERVSEVLEAHDWESNYSEAREVARVLRDEHGVLPEDVSLRQSHPDLTSAIQDAVQDLTT